MAFIVVVKEDNKLTLGGFENRIARGSDALIVLVPNLSGARKDYILSLPRSGPTRHQL